MATTASESDLSTSQVSSPDAAAEGESRGVGRVLVVLTVIGLIAVGVFGTRSLVGNMSGESTQASTTHEVARGDILITVTEDGNLESASNVDIKCQVAGGSSILWIVEDGKVVEKGEKLVELDASALEEQISQQTIVYEKAKSTKITAEKNVAVAKLAFREYLEGTFKQLRQDQEALITIALENLRSAQTAVEYGERMFRKGYLSMLELEGQKFAVERAQLELDSARTALDVLERFTKPKTIEDLKSQEATAIASLNSETAAFELEEARLKRLESQLKNCLIIAPQSGMVVYATPRGGRFGSQQQSQIEEGAPVREQQTILQLPDLSQMQVKVNVHESKVEQLRPGMRARIRILNREVTGSVVSVANQPEQTSFFSANVKEYATGVRINGQPEGLRPGMTAEVEILIAHLKDALTLPVAAVVEQRGSFACWVQTPDAVERRPLVLGLSNDQFVEVKDGVAEGEKVLLNPRAVVAEARIDSSEEEEQNITERFGDGAVVTPAAEEGPGGGAFRGGRGRDGRPRDGGGQLPGEGGGRRRPGAGGPEDGPQDGDRPRGGGGRGRGGFDLMSRDTDGDGKVSREEAPEQMSQFFDRMDENGDGFIDKAEVDSMRKRFGGGGGRPPGAGRPPGGGNP